jgi:hypothetical protein
VPLQFESQLQLGADAVGTRNEHRFAVVPGHFEQGAETTDAAEHAGAHGFSRERLDTFDEFIASVDVDTGIAIG